MRRVAVIGVGVTKFGKHDRSSAELFAEAARDAIVDAEIDPRAIQALYYGNVTGGEGERQLHMGPLAATLLGPPTIPTTPLAHARATSHAALRPPPPRPPPHPPPPLRECLRDEPCRLPPRHDGSRFGHLRRGARGRSR